MNKNLKQIAVPLVSVLLGLVLGAIIMWAFSYDALWGYELLFKKAFGSIKSWGNISRAMGPLILVALGFSVASRAGFFNVGLPGQAFAGWIMATWFALSFPNMPRLLMIPMTVLIAAIGISVSGRTEAVIHSLQSAKKCGAAVILMTSHIEKKFQNFCDEIMLFAVKANLEKGKAISPQFPILVMVDIIYSRMLRMDDFRRETLHEYTLEVLERDS